jgi:hypothetical protein
MLLGSVRWLVIEISQGRRISLSAALLMGGTIATVVCLALLWAAPRVGGGISTSAWAAILILTPLISVALLWAASV